MTQRKVEQLTKATSRGNEQVINRQRRKCAPLENRVGMIKIQKDKKTC